ncbi:hypothetical protein L6452_39996 [Arctium lappa]|uniref:Uncharacterized protein n=1 Tax=Arctium lappa TaxID=4217 RepID=A0ACB8XTV9_ARCLA|nr:hypothetical protein L6452_39996 [Arctium lappa]
MPPLELIDDGVEPEDIEAFRAEFKRLVPPGTDRLTLREIMESIAFYEHKPLCAFISVLDLCNPIIQLPVGTDCNNLIIILPNVETLIVLPKRSRKIVLFTDITMEIGRLRSSRPTRVGRFSN